MVDANDLITSELNQIGDEPLYNIGVATRMTGISKATLRAWERRYGFPDSERTSGGHRLYSERDIIQLRWVKNRIDQGMQTAQAIRALRHHASLGKLDEELAADVREDVPIVSMPELETSANPLMLVYQKRLLQAFLAKDTQQADQVLSEALASATPETLIVEVLSPTLRHIGHSWEHENLSVAVEHLATNFVRQRLMQWMLSSPPARSGSPIVLACGPGEWHEISLLIMGALLRRRRWPIAYLGQSMPLSDLARFVQDTSPSLVILVAMTETAAVQLAEWPKWLPDAAQTGKPIIGYGGRVYVENLELRRQTPGLYLGDTYQEGLATVETLLMGS